MVFKRLLFCLLITTNVLFSNAQVNLQTGAAEFSIPLYSYSDPANRLSTGISLVYTAGNGLKVSDVGTCVGTGWALSLGGEIRRIQRGVPDDQKQEGTFPYPIQYSTPPIQIYDWYNYVNNYYPNGYLYSEFPASDLVDNGGGYMPQMDGAVQEYLQDPIYLTDREQDIFSFSFGGRTGTFLIGKDGSIKTTVDSKLKIEKVLTNMLPNNIITRISEFQITDESGIKYIFKDMELNELVNYKRQINDESLTTSAVYPGTITPNSYNIYRGEAKNLFVGGKWYLTEIINPLVNAKIVFNYENIYVDMIGNKIYNMSYGNNHTDRNMTLERIKGVSKRIKSIICSNREKVDFSYASNNRADLSFDKALDEIQVSFNGVKKVIWKFNFGYFVKDEIKSFDFPLTQEQKYQARLCLLSLQRKTPSSNLNEKPYFFQYNIGNYTYVDQLNGYTYTTPISVSPLFSFYQDYLGYPKNGSSVNNYLHQPRPDIGYGNIDWDDIDSYLAGLNNKKPYGANRYAGILREIKYPSGGSLAYEYDYNISTATNGQQVLVPGARVGRTILFDNIDHSNDIITEYKYVRDDGLSSGWGYEEPIFENMNDQRIYRCDGASPAATVVTVASSLPGLFARNWVNFGGYGWVNMSAGINAQSFNQIIAAIIIYIVRQFFTPSYIDFSMTTWSSFHNNSDNPLPMQYSQVEVTKRLNSGNVGKTIIKFTSDSDYPIDVPTLLIPNSHRPRGAYWQYGLPKSTSIFDENGKLISKTENSYQSYKTTLTDNNFVSQSWSPNKSTSGCNLSAGQNLPTNEIDHDVYYPIYGRIELTSTKEFIYNSDDEYALTETFYEYSTDNYLPKKVSTHTSKGELIEAHTYYPSDYTLTGVIQSMKNSNMLNVPVSSQTFITKNGQKYLLGGSVSEFSVLANNDIKPTKTYAFQHTAPVISTSVAFNAAQLNPNSTYYKETGSLSYNSDGLPIEMRSDNGVASTLYNYDKKLPVATIVNATADQVAYTSFEGDESGNWNLDAVEGIEDDGVTGKWSAYGIAYKGFSQPGNYIVTAWCKGTITVNNAAGTLLHTIGNWKLYKWRLTNVSSVQVASDNMDELRLYPENARMTTVTYDPLVGKTSECDASDRIVYYEYDKLGRLRFERDENRNMIRMYEYNYKR